MWIFWGCFGGEQRDGGGLISCLHGEPRDGAGVGKTGVTAGWGLETVTCSGAGGDCVGLRPANATMVVAFCSIGDICIAIVVIFFFFFFRVSILGAGCGAIAACFVAVGFVGRDGCGRGCRSFVAVCSRGESCVVGRASGNG